MRVRNSINFKSVERQIKVTIGVFADTAAKKMEAEAKQNASWTDRTGNARNSILGEFGWRGNKAVITLSENMEYSPYLELAHEKKYAILVPTIQRNAPKIIRAYRKLV